MHIYFSGIGGSGLSPLANLAIDCGYQVSGSDLQMTSNITDLQDRGAFCATEQSLEEISNLHSRYPIDWIVHTSALSQDHPHLIFASNNNIQITKRHTLINHIIKSNNLKLIAIAGTHGKTTTTGMLVWAMKQLQLPVSYLVGTNISYGRSGEFDVNSKYFVYECDEFDRNFLNFEPFLSIIPSLDYDHRDTYPTELDYVESFGQFFNQSANVLAWQSTINYMNEILVKNSKKESKYNNIQILDDISIADQALWKEDKLIKLAGIHSRRNAFLVVACILKHLLESTDIAQQQLDYNNTFEAINSFVGTNRRFEKLQLPDNLLSNLDSNLDSQSQGLLFSDYGHHPVEISATLNMASEVIIQQSKEKSKTAKLILIYQPHQNIRQHEQDIQQGYSSCFALADKVFWLPTYLSRENDLPVLTPQDLINKNISTQDQSKFQIANLDQDLFAQIKNHLNDGDLVTCMGAGSIDNWIRDYLTTSTFLAE